MQTAVETTVTMKTEMDRGRECLVEITKMKGLQTLTVNGKPSLVESVTYKKYPNGRGTIRNFTPARPPKNPEEEAALLAEVTEIATNGLIQQGIW